VLAVAQFRESLFELTETFLYNYFTAFRQVLPVCVTLRRKNAHHFPFSQPLVVLHSPSLWDRGWRLMRRMLWRNDPGPRYDLPKTFEAFRRYDVRVLHAHFGWTGCQLLPVKYKTELPLITTFYGVDISAFARSDKWQQAYVELFSEGDLFLVEGPHMRERLMELGCPPVKAAIQRIAIPIDRYPFRKRLPLAKREAVRVLFCGRFREKKGLLYALEAVRLAHERFPNLQFRIVGDGELRPQIKQMLDRCQMGSYTILLGLQSHQRTIEEMDSADIFISHSVTAADGDSEGGAPTTILEAQACGLPVLSTMHADIPNVVVPGESALLAPERDVETLADNLLTLLSEPERWSSMGSTGRGFVERYHDIGIEVGLLEDRYYELAASSAT
jgi:colanic acid/amylovoran biosynthesis glycosyltransferase